MKKNHLGLLSVIVLSVFLTTAEAAPQRTTRKPVKIVEYDDQQDDDYTPRSSVRENNWYLFGGLDLGFSEYGAYAPTTEGKRSGFDGGIRALLARYWPKWVLDGGLGYRYISNSGTNSNGDQIKVTTRAGYLDLSPRYRFGKGWQFGPEFQYWLTGDNGMNPDPTNTIQNNAALLGAQLLYEWPGDENKFRLGARWNTTINVAQRSVNVFQAFFQIGFTIFDGNHDEDREPRHRNEQVNDRDLERAETYVAPADPLPIATPWPTPEATPWPTPEEPLPIPTPEQTPWPTPVPVVAAPKAQERLVLTLDVNDLPFAFDSARLPKYNADRLREVGRFLGEHKNTWKRLDIEGHTDERGSNQYNDKLSLARAQTVKQLLGEGGAPSAKMKAMGYGERHPKSRGHNEKAWAQNRRVELVFKGVKDVVIMRDALKR